MKMFWKYLQVSGCCLLLFACSKEPKIETVVEKVPVMKASSLYKPEMVYDYQQAHGNFHEEMAASYLAKAKEVEETNLQKAIYFTKRAITLQPTLEYYKQLAVLLGKAEQHDEMLQLYQLLVLDQKDRTTKKETPLYIFGKPDEALLYEFLAVNVLAKSYYTGMIVEEANRLEIPLENLRKRLLADQRLGFTPTSREYQALKFYFLSEEELQAFLKSEVNFRNYLTSIKDTASTFEIGEKAVPQFNYEIAYEPDLEEIPTSQFFIHYLPEVQKELNTMLVYDLKRRVKINHKVQAVIYAVDSSEAGCPAEMRHLYYRLVTYNQKGKILQSQIVASQDGDVLSTLSFAQNKFSISDYKRTWKQPYNKANFDNYLVKTEKTGERHFEIKPDGSIVPVIVPSATEADTLVAQTLSPDKTLSQ